MSWEDAVWKRSGCPNHVLGSWHLDSHSPNAPKEMKIDRGQIHFNFPEKGNTSIAYRGQPAWQKGPYIHLELIKTPDANAFPPILKIRPHLQGAATQTGQTCSIKVFHFMSEKDARHDKYIHWDIFSATNANAH